MPIEFACACGKAFKVADAYAGKRSKCTACGQPVVVPVPQPVPADDPTDEDAAARALLDGDDPEPAPRTGGYAGRAESPPPRPVSPPPPRPVPTSAASSYTPKSKIEQHPALRAKQDTPTRPKASPNWAKVGGGIAMAVVGVVVLVGALVALGAGVPVQRWAFIVPGPLILAAPFFIIDGFRDRGPKK